MAYDVRPTVYAEWHIQASASIALFGRAWAGNQLSVFEAVEYTHCMFSLNKSRLQVLVML